MFLALPSFSKLLNIDFSEFYCLKIGENRVFHLKRIKRINLKQAILFIFIRCKIIS